MMTNSNITYLPSQTDLYQVFEHLDRSDPEKLKKTLADIALRVIEHSDTIKKIFEGEEDE